MRASEAAQQSLKVILLFSFSAIDLQSYRRAATLGTTMSVQAGKKGKGKRVPAAESVPLYQEIIVFPKAPYSLHTSYWL